MSTTDTTFTIIHDGEQGEVDAEERDYLVETGLIYLDETNGFYTAPFDVSWEQIEAALGTSAP